MENASKSLERTEAHIRNSLIAKGKTLTLNNSHALKGMAEDNAFSAVQDLVSTTVAEDDDIVYGIYMDKNQQPWVFANANNPSGAVTEQKQLTDQISNWATNLTKPAYRLTQYQNQSVYEFASPVTIDAEILGTMRYALTTKSMHEALAQAKYVAQMTTFQTLVLLFALGLAALAAGIFATIRTSTNITNPLAMLTQAANSMADGDYASPITVNSEDEVGALAHDFEKMRKTIQDMLARLLDQQKDLKAYSSTLQSKNQILKQAQNELEDLNKNLEDKVKERTKELKETQDKLIDSARFAGMAEIAINVLHNVGNVLNSVTIANQKSITLLHQSKVVALTKTLALVDEHKHDIGEYFQNDPKGCKVPSILQKIASALTYEHQELMHSMDRQSKGIVTIQDIIDTQQKYAKVGLIQEEVSLSQLITDAIELQAGSIGKHNINISKRYQDVPNIALEKSKLLQIIVNLLVNAKEAMLTNAIDNKTIIIELYRKEGEGTIIKITDNGIGISPANLNRIFNHGFTTKPTGHGFGLHSCANFMTEMHGNIQVESDGEDKGASFILLFPDPKKSS